MAQSSKEVPPPWSKFPYARIRFSFNSNASCHHCSKSLIVALLNAPICRSGCPSGLQRAVKTNIDNFTNIGTTPALKSAGLIIKIAYRKLRKLVALFSHLRLRQVCAPKAPITRWCGDMHLHLQRFSNAALIPTLAATRPGRPPAAGSSCLYPHCSGSCGPAHRTGRQ